MFRLSFFRIRIFTAGNVRGFLSAIALGRRTFMFIKWLALPGFNFKDTLL